MCLIIKTMQMKQKANHRYTITIARSVRIAWMEWRAIPETIYPESKDDIVLYADIVREDESICSAFWTDKASGQQTIIK